MVPAVQCYHLEFSYLLNVINLAFRGRGFRRCAMQNSRKKSKIDIRLFVSFLNKEQNLYNRNTLFTDVGNTSRKCLVTGLPQFPGEGEGRGGEVRWYSTNRYAGRLRPEVQPPTFLYTSFVRKRYPFSYTFYWQIVPLTCLVWNLILLKMHCLLLWKIVFQTSRQFIVCLF